MLTSRPFSGISYNTESYLQRKNEQLTNQGIIEFWMYIKHLAEDETEKNHIHFWCWPAKRIDTRAFAVEYDQFVMGEDKPRKLIIKPGHSDFANAYLYFLHDPDYLSSKDLQKKYHYSPNQLVVSDADMFHELYDTIDWSSVYHNNRAVVVCKEFIQNNKDWPDVIASGLVPPQQYVGWEKIFAALKTLFDERGSF